MVVSEHSCCLHLIRGKAICCYLAYCNRIREKGAISSKVNMIPKKKQNKKPKIIELPYDPAIPLLGIYTKELKAGSHRDIRTPMFSASLLTCQDVEAAQMFMDRWMDKKMWCVCIIYTALKKKEIMSFASTWMNLEDIMLNEMSVPKSKYYMDSLE